MRDDFDALARRLRTLKVATVAPAPSWRLAALVVERYPGTILDPEILDPSRVDLALFSREADLAITLHPIQAPGMLSTPLMTEDLYLNAHLKHHLAKRRTVNFSDLDGESFLVFEQIGFWMEMCRRNLPGSQLIVQKDRTVFAQLVKSTELCSFSTDAPENLSLQADRIQVPIVDAEAHATFFLCVRQDATERAREIFGWVRKGATEA